MTAEELWQKSGLQGSYEAWAFGGAPDKLAELTRKGIKTATCSALVLYEQEGEEIPKEGDYSVILNARQEAVCIIRTTKVYIESFDKVSTEHAFKEGEGDRSLIYWREVHREFFTDELESVNMTFDEKMKLVCEEFEVVYEK
ncbi:MAG: ASCH domain-containing protein [Erysipelotrichaceae bacterium]|nr:ASCH domain-containing protein [Erysipelotrichaceae bacterium]